MDKNLKHKKGFTLIESVIYMSVYIILTGGVLSTAFYLQRVMEHSALEYAVQEKIYMQLELIQNYLVYSSDIQISSSSIRMRINNSFVTQELRGDFIYMVYEHSGQSKKEFKIFPHIRFKKFSFKKQEYGDTLQTQNILYVELERVDNQDSTKTLQEYVYLLKS